ncbi:MAG: A24 family peptidase [Chloroflexota bacterium]|nr:A24 family peptidase [Chloroflexota bacterium]
MTPAALAVGLGFAALGAGAERLASVWPADEASHRPPGLRTGLLAAAAAIAGGAMALRSTLPAWALGVQLVILAILVLLTATDLEQRRLPHLLLDPLIVVAVLFVPFNPTVDWRSALLGAGAGVAFMGLLGLLVRGGVAFGDLLLVAPLGLILGWPAVFVAMFVAGILSAVVSLGLLLSRRAGLKSYIPFAPFLVAGAVITLLRDPELLGSVVAALIGLRQT